MKLNTLIFKISSLGCLCMLFLLSLEEVWKRRQKGKVIWHGGQKEQHYTAEGARDQYGGLSLKSFFLCFWVFKKENQPSLLFQKPKKLAGPQGTHSTTTDTSH